MIAHLKDASAVAGALPPFGVLITAAWTSTHCCDGSRSARDNRIMTARARSLIALGQLQPIQNSRSRVNAVRSWMQPGSPIAHQHRLQLEPAVGQGRAAVRAAGAVKVERASVITVARLFLGLLIVGSLVLASIFDAERIDQQEDRGCGIAGTGALDLPAQILGRHNQALMAATQFLPTRSVPGHSHHDGGC